MKSIETPEGDRKIKLAGEPEPKPDAKIFLTDEDREYPRGKKVTLTEEEKLKVLKKRESKEPIPKNILDLKERISYLNKARQGNVEYEDVYRRFTKERADLAKRFAVGKNGEPYSSTRPAAHDLVEFLAQEAEGSLKEAEEKIRKERIRKEIEEQKNILALLNKARQGNLEHEDIYWHVFGRESTTRAPCPPSWVKRSDLLEKFSVGKDKNYKNTREASHDLIEFLAEEAEEKIQQLSEKPKPKKEEVIEEEIPSVPENEPGEEAPLAAPEGETGPQPVLPPRAVENNPPLAAAEVAPQYPESTQSLEDLRDAYLKAKRLRGNVFRGGLGRFFKRTLNFRDERMNFGGKKGAEELKKVREEYQDALLLYRVKELGQLDNTLIEGGVTEAERNVQLRQKIIDLLREEQRRIDERSVEGIERNRLEKWKTTWRQYRKTRLVAGGLLGGAALVSGGTAFGAGVVGTRAAMGSVSTYTGVEAALEYNKLIGHKGLVKEISRRNFITEDALIRHIYSLPPEEIKKEAARLRMLQVEKGVSIYRLEAPGDDGRIANLIVKRDDEITATEALYEAGRENQAALFANILSEKLALEIDSRNEIVEKMVNRESWNKMWRKTIAALAGGMTGWLIGGKLFENINLPKFGGPGTGSPEIPPSPVRPPVSPIEPVAPPESVSFEHTVGRGENLWKIIENNLDSRSTMAGLGEGQRTHMIDALKDMFDNMSQSELKGLGFSSGDADLLYVGDKLELSGILDNPSLVTRALMNSKNLTPAEITEIVKNNAVIAKWFAEHHRELTQVFDSSVVEKVLRGLI